MGLKAEFRPVFEICFNLIFAFMRRYELQKGRSLMKCIHIMETVLDKMGIVE
jgi:hypothetical protein